MESILQARVRNIFAAFNLKCKQSQMKYPSSRHLLEWDSNQSSLKLASFILSEQRQPILLKSTQLSAR